MLTSFLRHSHKSFGGVRNFSIQSKKIKVFSLGHLAAPRAMFRMSLQGLLDENSVIILEKSWIHRIDKKIAKEKVWGQQFLFNLTYEWRAFAERVGGPKLKELYEEMQEQIRMTHEILNNKTIRDNELTDIEKNIVTIDRIREADILFKNHIRKEGIFKIIETDEIESVEVNVKTKAITVRGRQEGESNFSEIFTCQADNYHAFVDGLSQARNVHLIKNSLSFLQMLSLSHEEREKITDVLIFGSGPSAAWLGEKYKETTTKTKTKYVVTELIKTPPEGRNSVIKIPISDQILIDDVEIENFKKIPLTSAGKKQKKAAQDFAKKNGIPLENLEKDNFYIVFKELKNEEFQVEAMGTSFKAAGFTHKLFLKEKDKKFLEKEAPTLYKNYINPHPGCYLHLLPEESSPKDENMPAVIIDSNHNAKKFIIKQATAFKEVTIPKGLKTVTNQFIKDAKEDGKIYLHISERLLVFLIKEGCSIVSKAAPDSISSTDLPLGHNGLAIGHLGHLMSRAIFNINIADQMRLIPFENGAISLKDMPIIIKYMREKGITVEEDFFRKLQKDIKFSLVSDHLLAYKKAFLNSSKLPDNEKYIMARNFIEEIRKIEEDVKQKVKNSIDQGNMSLSMPYRQVSSCK